MANEKRLIDAIALRSNIDCCDIEIFNDKFTIIEQINEAPTVDAVEVVRCKDCKHFTEGMAVGMCKRDPNQYILPVPYNHFCSYGERKDNG